MSDIILILFGVTAFTLFIWKNRKDENKAAKLNEEAVGKEYNIKQLIDGSAKPLQPYEPEASGTENGHEYVDLGLPSGRLWAVCNIGATSADGTGSKFFPWGTHRKYDVMTYEAGGAPIPKFNDAAADWEGDWHMPTAADIEELLSHCTAQLAKCGEVEGVMLTASNGSRVFFPFCDRESEKRFEACLRANDSENGFFERISYWSSEANGDGSLTKYGKRFAYAFSVFYTTSSGVTDIHIGAMERTYALAVRPVI